MKKTESVSLVGERTSFGKMPEPERKSLIITHHSGSAKLPELSPGVSVSRPAVKPSRKRLVGLVGNRISWGSGPKRKLLVVRHPPGAVDLPELSSNMESSRMPSGTAVKPDQTRSKKGEQ